MKHQRNRILSFTLYRRTVKTRTTMFELMETLHEVTDSEEAEWIPQIVLHMVNSGQLKAIGDLKVFKETRQESFR